MPAWPARCGTLLTAASCWELVPQEAAVRESILSPPPGKPSTDHKLSHPTRNVSVPAGIILCKQISGEATAELSGAGFEVGKMRMTLLWPPFTKCSASPRHVP